MTTSLSPRDRRFGSGGVLAALLVGGLVYGVSCLIVPPGNALSDWGVDWQKMSEQPFAFVGRFPHRMLAPLLAFLLGLGGADYLLFARGLSIVLLATVFFYCREKNARPVDGLLITLAVALTATVQMYKKHWVGYIDPLSYTLFFWMALVARRPAILWTLFFLNLANHELAAFLLPWLWFLRRQVDGNWRADAIGAGTALALYAAFHFAVKTLVNPLFSVSYFLGHPLFPGGTVVTWAVALVQWTVAFGPILAVLAWHQHTPAHGRERWHLWLVLAGVAGIFCIAFDWQRHTNLVVLPLVIASLRFLAAGHRVAYAVLVGLGTGLMLWIPPWPSVSWPTNSLANLPLLVDTGVVIDLEGPGLDIGFGPLSATMGRWLPEVWPTLLAVYAILAAIWTAGFAFARWSGRASAEPAPTCRA